MSRRYAIPERVVDRLLEMGYFKFLPASESETTRQELIASLSHGYLGTEWNDDCVSRDRRSYPADNEELAEGRTGEFILLMRDVLFHEGVRFQSVEDDFQDDQYDVVIDGSRYPVHDTKTLATWAGWTIAAKRLLEIVNELLATAGSSERLFGVYGGNDGRAVFLTNEMYDLIKSSDLISDLREMPYPAAGINTDGSINW